MHRVLRAVLIWVLVAGLPLQGLAAAAMWRCASGPGHAPAASEHHHGAAPAPHDTTPTGLAASPAAGHHAQGGDCDTPQHAPGQCSACAACCVALALPARPALPSADGPTQPAPLATAHSLASPPPAGFERPPRSALA